MYVKYVNGYDDPIYTDVMQIVVMKSLETTWMQITLTDGSFIDATEAYKNDDGELTFTCPENF